MSHPAQAERLYPNAQSLGIVSPMLTPISSYIGPPVESRRTGLASQRSARYRLLRFAAATGDPTPDQLTAEHAEAWWSSTASLAPGTRRGHYSTVRCFTGWLRVRGALAGDPLAGIVPPREPRRNPATLTPAETQALWATAGPEPRMRAVLALMWGLGLRCIDVAQLEIADFDWHGGLVTIHGKGGHVDVLPLPSMTAEHVLAYLRAHPATAGPLIRDARWHRHPVTAARLSEMLADLARRAGVKHGRWDGRGAHALRRTFGTELLEQGAHIRQVQALLRHRSIQTTESYLRRSDAAELRHLVDGRRSA